MSSAPLSKKFMPQMGRYARVILRNGRVNPNKHNQIISLSEIELLCHGKNLLRGIPFKTEEPLVLGQPVKISPYVLSDGNSTFGTIIPQKQWFLQLADRTQLERLYKKLSLQRQQNYNRQKWIIRNLLLVIPILVVVFVYFSFRNRVKHKKKIQDLRERIADDLHDETGATLSSIANSAQLLAEISHNKNCQVETELIQDIIESAERSAQETRALILFLEKDSSQGDLIERFRKTARQMLAGRELTLDLKAEKILTL